MVNLFRFLQGGVGGPVRHSHIRAKAGNGLLKGFSWGLLVFGPHFIWLLVLLGTKSQAPLSLAILGYALIVCYFSLTSGVWVWLVGLASAKRFRFAWLIFITGVYYYFIENFSLCIFGRLEGYPFLNPLIPLAEYRPFLWLVAKFGVLVRWIMFGGAFAMTPLTPGDIRLVYLSPLKGEQNNAVAVGQRVYHKLATVHQPFLCHPGRDPGSIFFHIKTAKPLIIVAPESFYQFSLNKHPKQVALWASVIPDDASLIIGTQKSVGNKIYQSAALMQCGLINKYYVKHHCVPFVEKIPKFCKRMASLRDMFLQNADEFSRGKTLMVNSFFDIGQDVRLIPQICSEFFFVLSAMDLWRLCYNRSDKKTAVLFLIKLSLMVHQES